MVPVTERDIGNCQSLCPAAPLELLEKEGLRLRARGIEVTWLRWKLPGREHAGCGVSGLTPAKPRPPNTHDFMLLTRIVTTFKTRLGLLLALTVL